MCDFWGLPIALVFEEFFKDERKPEPERKQTETTEKETEPKEPKRVKATS